MRFKEYLKNLWSDLRYNESGQWYLPNVPGSQPYIPTAPDKKKKLIKRTGQYQSPTSVPTTNVPDIGGGTSAVPLGGSSGNTSGGTSGSYSIPQFEVDLAGIWETAGQMADAEINPQNTEKDRLQHVSIHAPARGATVPY